MIRPTLLMAGAVLLTTTVTHAAGTPEQACLNGRYVAAAKYSACEQKFMGKYFAGNEGKFEAGVSKCRTKYTVTWAKLQKKASGTGATCDNPRFDTTTTPGTVIDRLTGLQWEQKTDDTSVHDKDNVYTWNTVLGGAAANGTAYTGFLAALNGAGCFAGQCDWRLPTIAELQTILSEPYPCTTSPCIDQVVFGPTVAAFYWSATTYASPTLSYYAWDVSFDDGFVFATNKDNAAFDSYVRGVRGGL